MIKKSWRTFLLICSLFCTFSLLGCTSAEKKDDATLREIAVSKMSEEEKLDKMIKKLTDEKKIGQLMIIGIHAASLDNDINYMLGVYAPGGVIYYDRNLDTPEQVKKLSADLQNASPALPLFVAIDEEGGDVVRMEDYIEPPPAQEEIGETGDKNEAKRYAKETGDTLKSLGINVNFAPVLDLGSLSTRHYSTDAKEVTEFAEMAAQGYEESNIIYALKHFPGIGKSDTDTHFSSAIVELSADELMEDDIVPFKAIIDKKRHENFFVMVSHVIYPEISGDKPASLSKEIMSDLLRDKLKFGGVIVSDDLEMTAATNSEDFSRLGVEAIKAGADIVLVCHEYERQKSVYDGLLSALKSGELSPERLNASLKRILRMKLKHLYKNTK